MLGFSQRLGMAKRKGMKEPPRSPQPDPPASAICIVDSFRPAENDLKVDPSWLSSASIDGVTYALPPKILERLARASRIQTAAAILKTETAFWADCQAHRAVGICESKAVRYPYLAGMDALPASASTVTAGWSADSCHALLMAEDRALEVRERLKGYLGWLVTEPAFLRERDKLRSDWRRFPADQAPSMPLRRIPRTVQPGAEIVAVPEALAGFLGAADAFLKKWSLAGLITWELPEPVGPQFPDPLPLHTRAVDYAVVHIVLPAHYSLQGSDALLKEIRGQQRWLAEDQGIPDPVGHMSHYVAYGQMFEVAFWEQILRHRFEHLHLKGFVLLLEKAIASHLGISIPQVQKHRKAISACRRGLRHNVPHLQVKN